MTDEYIVVLRSFLVEPEHRSVLCWVIEPRRTYSKYEQRPFFVTSAICAYSERHSLSYYCRLLGAGDILATTTSIDDVDASKPEPDIFATALARVGVPPEAALAVGDTPYDMEASGRAGVAGIGLTSGPFSEGVLRHAGAVAVYSGTTALLADFDRSALAS